MATITEDYVSFEVAKLLKEKGFDEECKRRYNCRGELSRVDSMVYMNSHRDMQDKYVAPTLQMVMKWLREVHNIMVSPYALSLGYYFEIFDLTNRDITGCKPLYEVGIPYKVDVLSTYEQAAETAIKYCLENLI